MDTLSTKIAGGIGEEIGEKLSRYKLLMFGVIVVSISYFWSAQAAFYFSVSVYVIHNEITKAAMTRIFKRQNEQLRAIIECCDKRKDTDGETLGEKLAKGETPNLLPFLVNFSNNHTD